MNIDFTDISIIAGMLIGLAEIIKQIGLPNKLIPVANIAIGILIGILHAYPSDIVRGIMFGITAALMASGAYSGVKNVAQAIRGDDNDGLL